MDSGGDEPSSAAGGSIDWRAVGRAVLIVAGVAGFAFSVVVLVFGVDTRGVWSRDRGGSIAEWAAAAGTFLALVLLVYELQLLRGQLDVAREDMATTDELVRRQQRLLDEAADEKRSRQAAVVTTWFRFDPERSKKHGAYDRVIRDLLLSRNKQSPRDVYGNVVGALTDRPWYEAPSPPTGEDIATLVEKAGVHDEELGEWTLGNLEHLKRIGAWVDPTDGDPGTCCAFNVVVSNRSDEPVFDATVFLSVESGVRRKIRVLPVVEPGELVVPFEVENPWEASPRSDPERFTSVYRPVIEFADSAGRSWRRDFRSQLTEIR